MQTRAYACLCMPVHACACISMHIHVYPYICVPMHGYACICMHMHACICMHIYAYACICMHMHAYPCLCVSNTAIHVFVYQPQLSMCLCIGHCVSAIPMCDMHSVTPVIHYYHVFGLLCVCLLVQYVCILFLVLLKVIIAGNIDGPIIVGCFCSLIAVQPSAAGAQL